MKMDLFSQLEKIHAALVTTRLISDLLAKQMTPLVFIPYICGSASKEEIAHYCNGSFPRKEPLHWI